MGRAIKVILSVVAALAIIIIAVYFALPPFLKSFLVKNLSENLHREVALKQITINPLRLTVTLDSFQVKDAGAADTFVGFDRLFLNIDTFSIFRRALILKEIRLTNPTVRVTRRDDGSYNFSDLIPKTDETAEKKSQPLQFSLNNIHIENGSVDFWDGPKKIAHKVREINVSVPFISNMAHYVDEYVDPYLSANINGGLYVLQGKTKPFEDSRESVFDIDIKDLNIPYYLSYVPFKMNFKMLSGLLSTKTSVSFIQYRDKKPAITIKGDTTLKDLAVDEEGKQRLLRIPMLQVSAASLEPLTSVYHFSKIAVSSPELIIRRNKAGKLNLLSLIPPQKEVKKKDEAPMIMKIDDLGIDDGKIQFFDALPSMEGRFDISGLSLKGSHLSTERNTKANISLSMRLDKTGVVAVAGPLGLDPLSANLTVNVKSVKLLGLQPYVDEKLKVSITDGKVSMSGRISLQAVEKNNLKASYAGNILIANFATVDKINGDGLLKWNSLFFKNVRAGYNPLYLRVSDISLADFYARLIVLPDGTINLQHITEEQAVVKPKTTVSDKNTTEQAVEKPKRTVSDKNTTQEADKPMKDIQIGALSLQNGTIDFQDRHIKPNYAAKLVEIGGRVSGISSMASKTADVDLRGKLNNSAPLEIAGRIHPFPDNLFLDLKAVFKDMDLSPLSPYSGKYAGYSIRKGKLSFDLQYLIVEKKLDAKNKIFLNQFNFGDRVESPQATKLPVKLAVALLQDRKGDIDLDIPVTGSLNDPQFSVWQIVFKVIGNLIAKAATAPFAILGSLFGHGEELSYIEFDGGSSSMGGAALKKMETLIKALHERPGLKLDIEGHVDIEKDREGLMRNQFIAKLKAQKLKELIRHGQKAVSVDDVQINEDEYKRYLTLAYDAEKFPKPRTALGMKKSLPVPEMEKLMMTNIKVSDSDLRLLASQRAIQTQSLLLKDGTISADRIFVVEPKTIAAEKKEKAKNSRVDFLLK
jgi:uncharacterized protein involved in outer membrane biogenesis